MIGKIIAEYFTNFAQKYLPGFLKQRCAASTYHINQTENVSSKKYNY